MGLKGDFSLFWRWIRLHLFSSLARRFDRHLLIYRHSKVSAQPLRLKAEEFVGKRRNVHLELRRSLLAEAIHAIACGGSA